MPAMSASFEKIAQDVAAADRPASDPMSLERMDRAPTHPGEIFIRDFLESGAWGKQTAAARAMGWRFSRLNDFVLGKRSLTHEDVLDVAEFTKTSPEFWATLQMRHDLWHAMQERRQRDAAESPTT
jgi:addiction module HigA family antidote